jgi:hypothetical protein
VEGCELETLNLKPETLFVIGLRDVGGTTA